MKKIFLMLLTISMFFAFLAISSPASAAENSSAISFTPADVVFSDDGTAVYLSDKAGKTVYCIDTETLERKSISFDLMPESMYYKDGKLYVSLCTQAHSDLWWEDDQSGAFAVIDCESFTESAQYDINIDPYDIVVSNNDIVYIASGSGQFAYIGGFNEQGKTVATGQIDSMSTIEYNPVLDRIYSITSDTTPRNMSAFMIKSDGSFEDRGGNMGTSYRWPYHGDYDMGTTFQISPDSANIFNSSGNVFTCDADTASDMKFKVSLDKNWSALGFDKSGTRFFAAVSGVKQIYAYDYASFQGTATYETKGYPQYIFVKGDIITAISREASNEGAYFIEAIDLTAPKTILETTITKKSLSYTNGHALLGMKSDTKTVFSGDMIYVADSIDNAVYAIDMVEMTETKIAFQETPNSLYFDNGELFVGFGDNGVLAIFDADTFEVKERFFLGTVFHDVAIGKDGFIYIVDSYRDYARSFSRASGQEISCKYINNTGKLVQYPTYNMFYWADMHVSPQDIEALKYENGVIGDIYDSPYHGDYDIGSKIVISPDGANIFADAGNIFACSPDAANDMKFKMSLNKRWSDLGFDETGARFFTAVRGVRQIYAYDYATFQGTATYETKGYPQYIFVKGNIITAISREAFDKDMYEGAYFIETIDLTAPKPTMETTITNKSLSYANGHALLGMKSGVKTVFEGGMIYVADSIDNAVYAIDTVKLTETKIAFHETPNSLYYDSGELFIGFGGNELPV
ncbi:MAG: hypothetical protein LBL49_08280 [Clostridiales Family XIII bacterium]|nr:hypothetical protein [Clostridiales Family XIII bacterium]